LYVASITEHRASIQKLKFINAQMKGHRKLLNLDYFATVSRGILWTGPQNLAKFTVENCGP